MYRHPALEGPALGANLEHEYPRVSDTEYDRRRRLLAAAMQAHEFMQLPG